MRDLFSSPATIRSTAPVKSVHRDRIARRAASPAPRPRSPRFARSAPVKPGVSAAMSSSFTSGASFNFLQMDAQDVHPPLLVRPIHQHLAIEPPGPQQRRIQDLRPVGRRQDDDRHRPVEAVHLRQQLVERLFLLVLPAHRAGAARAAQRVQLVDEDDAGRRLAAPARTDRARGPRRRRRTSRRTRHRWWRRTARPPRPATARASSVLPVPGGPTSRMPRGICAPSRVYSSGRLRKSTISCSSAFASSTPATSAKVTFMSVSATSLARRAADRKQAAAQPPKPPRRRARPSSHATPTARCRRTAVAAAPRTASVPSALVATATAVFHVVLGQRRRRDRAAPGSC